MTDTRQAVEVTELVYARPAGQPLTARVYRPVGAVGLPIVLDLHGGAWNTGDRFSNERSDGLLAGDNFVVVAIDFRQPPSSHYPDSIADANFAVRWLKANAGALGGRSDRIGVFGTSSGGHMAMLNALVPDDARYTALIVPDSPGLDARVNCVVACYPVMDPLARYRYAKETGRSRIVAWHEAYWIDEAAMEEGNPQRILDRGGQQALPPVLVVQGTADENVTTEMAERFVAAYRVAGGDVELVLYPGIPHSFLPNLPDAAETADALARISRFLKAHLVVERS